MRRMHVLGGAAALALGLAACGGKPSAVASHDASASGLPAAAASASTADAYQARGQDPRDLPTPTIDGKPMWAANRRHTAEENAQYQFSKNGADFGAHSETEYVTKVHAFIDSPPRDVETIDRPNGDRLMYDAKGNVFAVVSRAGAPRTMFKPRDGQVYWTQQKAREARRAKSGQDGGVDQS
jgi:pyocin large subunit-like protein